MTYSIRPDEQGSPNTKEALLRKKDDKDYRDDLLAEYPKQRISRKGQKHFERG